MGNSDVHHITEIVSIRSHGASENQRVLNFKKVQILHLVVF